MRLRLKKAEQGQPLLKCEVGISPGHSLEIDLVCPDDEPEQGKEKERGRHQENAQRNEAGAHPSGLKLDKKWAAHWRRGRPFPNEFGKAAEAHQAVSQTRANGRAENKTKKRHH